MEVKNKYLCDIYQNVTRKVKVKAFILILVSITCIMYFGINHHCYQNMVDYYVLCYDDVRLVQRSIIDNKSVEELDELMGSVINLTNQDYKTESIYTFTYANAELGYKAYKIRGRISFYPDGKVKEVLPHTFSKEAFVYNVDVIMIQYTIIGVIIVIFFILLLKDIVICVSSSHKELNSRSKK